MSKLISRLKRHSLGAALVEYCVLIGLVAIAVILAVFLLGNQVRAIFLTVDDALASNIASAEVAELVEETAGADPILFNYSNPASYPDDGDCFPGSPGDWYDPAYTCFLVDAQPDDYYDYSSDTSDPLIVKMFGPTGEEDDEDTHWGMGVDVPSGSFIIDVDGPQQIWVGGYGDTEIALPNRSCSSALVLTSEWGPSFIFPDELIINASSEVARVWCGGDDVVLEGDDLADDGDTSSPPFGGGDEDLGGPSSEWTIVDGCLENNNTGEFWCKGSPPWDPLPNNLAWAQYEMNGDLCVFDKDTGSTVNDFTGQPGVCVTEAYSYQINSSDEILRFYPY